LQISERRGAERKKKRGDDRHDPIAGDFAKGKNKRERQLVGLGLARQPEIRRGGGRVGGSKVSNIDQSCPPAGGKRGEKEGKSRRVCFLGSIKKKAGEGALTNTMG